MDFSNIARQLNESPDDPAYTVAAGNEEKATLGGQKQTTNTNERKGRQKAQMSQTVATPKKSEISYASEQYRTEREYLKMMETAKSDWKAELNEAMGADPEGNHPFVDVMPFMDQKMQELKKQMKAAAGAKMANGDVGGERSMSSEFRKEEVLNEEELNELNRLEKEQGKKSGGSKDMAYRHVAKMMRDMQGKPKGQQKKVKGKKPPVAGQYGAPQSPAQKLSLKRKRKQDSIDMQTSRFD